MDYSSEQRKPLNGGPESPAYIISPMDAGYNYGKKDDDDDGEVGLGFQNTLVSVNQIIISIFATAGIELSSYVFFLGFSNITLNQEWMRTCMSAHISYLLTVSVAVFGWCFIGAEIMNFYCPL